MALTRLPSFTIDSNSSFTFANVTVTSNVAAANANLGNAATANYFIGNGSLLTSVNAATLNGFASTSFATSAQGTKADTALQPSDLSSYATQTYVSNAVANLVASAPAALDTLNELANALGNDASYSTTVTNALANKLSTSNFASTANTWISTQSTSNLSEGTNQYYTVARANTAIDARVTKSFVDNLAVVANVSNVAYSVAGADVTGAVAYATTANSVAVANVTGIGNIATINKDGNASNILYGNGVFASAPVTYANSNVSTFLASFGSNSITTTGNISSGNLTISGITNLGAVGNVKITGGNANQYLRTDGTGNLTWANATGGGGGASVTVSATAPSTPSQGDLWLDSESGELNVYFGGAWGDVSPSAGQLDIQVNNFTGDGIQSTFTLTVTPAGTNYTIVTIGGVVQPRNYYSISGSTLSLGTPPPANTPIEVSIFGGSVSPIGLAGSVTNGAQPNITSTGTLTGLNVTGNVAITGNLTVNNAAPATTGKAIAMAIVFGF